MATETKTVKPQEGYGTRFWNWLTETQVWTSVFRHERPNTDRNRVLVMLSNVFLHYVLDLWFAQDVKPRLGQRAFLVRYADDFVIGFRDQRDAQRVMDVLPKRFGKYGLTVHPTKTKLVPFRPPSATTAVVVRTGSPVQSKSCASNAS